MLVVLYLSAIVIANLSVSWFGPGASIVNAFFLIGLDITTRDALHERWHGRHLGLKMLALVSGGSALSLVFALLLNADATNIAIASFVAFASAGASDTIIYTALGRRSRLTRVNGSNVVSAAVDSLVFPALAFGFPLLWGIVLGQFVAKVAGGAVFFAIWSALSNRRAALA